MLIMPGASLEDTRNKADDLRQQVREIMLDKTPDQDLVVTISVGVAAYPQSGDRGDQILTAADAALYQAKALGRDQVVVAGATAGNGPDPLN